MEEKEEINQRVGVTRCQHSVKGTVANLRSKVRLVRHLAEVDLLYLLEMTK